MKKVWKDHKSKRWYLTTIKCAFAFQTLEKGIFTYELTVVITEYTRPAPDKFLGEKKKKKEEKGKKRKEKKCS